MRILPKDPYLENILKHWYDQGNKLAGTDEYIAYLKSFGFSVPVNILTDQLEFPDDFSDYEMMSFIMRWA